MSSWCIEWHSEGDRGRPHRGLKMRTAALTLRQPRRRHRRNKDRPSTPPPTTAAIAPPAEASAQAPAASRPVRKSTMMRVRWIMQEGRRR